MHACSTVLIMLLSDKCTYSCRFCQICFLLLFFILLLLYCVATIISIIITMMIFIIIITKLMIVACDRQIGRHTECSKICLLTYYVLTVCFAVLQDDVISKYDLTSVTLEKFFLGPLPEFYVLDSSNCMPAPARPPPINGCLPVTDHHSAVKSGGVVNDSGVIDLTDDDFEVPPVRTSPATVVAKKHVQTSGRTVQKNRKIKRGLLVHCRN